MSRTSSCRRVERKRARVVCGLRGCSWTQPERGAHGRGHQLGVGHRGQVDDRGAVLVVGLELGGEFGGEAGLSGAGGAGQGDQPGRVFVNQMPQSAELGGTPDERRPSRPTGPRLEDRVRRGSMHGVGVGRVVGTGRSGEIQGRVVPQDRVVEAAQRVGRLHAQLFDQGSPAVPEDAEGIDLAA